jgi:serine/threonine-protein kinase
VRVIVADDSLLTREGIVQLLTAAGIHVVAQAHDADSTLHAVATEQPDAVVVDIKMPPTHTDEGLVAAMTIHTDFPEIAVLVLSQYIEPGYALRLLEDHPTKAGYLLKERVFSGAILADALSRLCEGETVVDPTIVARLFNRNRARDPIEALSARERDVLALVAEGRSNKAIAEKLVIAERTVEAHVTQIFLKLEVDTSPGSHRRVLAVLHHLRRSG